MQLRCPHLRQRLDHVALHSRAGRRVIIGVALNASMGKKALSVSCGLRS